MPVNSAAQNAAEPHLPQLAQPPGAHPLTQTHYDMGNTAPGRGNAAPRCRAVCRTLRDLMQEGSLRQTPVKRTAEDGAERHTPQLAEPPGAYTHHKPHWDMGITAPGREGAVLRGAELCAHLGAADLGGRGVLHQVVQRHAPQPAQPSLQVLRKGACVRVTI